MSPLIFRGQLGNCGNEWVSASKMWGAKNTPTIQHPPRIWKARGSLVLRQWGAAIQGCGVAAVDGPR